MTRFQPPLAVLVSVAIATSAIAISFLLGSAAHVQACPLTDGFVSSEAIRQPDAANDASVMTRLPSDSQRQPSGYAELAGFGAVVGLFAIALLYKARRSRDAIASGAELNLHPQLEHPELTLISIPKEALPLVLAAEAVLVR